MNELAARTAAEVPESEKAAGMSDFAQIVRDNQAMVFSIAYNFLRDPALGRGTGAGSFSCNFTRTWPLWNRPRMPNFGCVR